MHQSLDCRHSTLYTQLLQHMANPLNRPKALLVQALSLFRSTMQAPCNPRIKLLLTRRAPADCGCGCRQAAPWTGGQLPPRYWRAGL